MFKRNLEVYSTRSRVIAEEIFLLYLFSHCRYHLSSYDFLICPCLTG